MTVDINSDTIQAIVRLLINAYVATRATMIAYQIFRYDSRLTAKGAAWFLLGMAGYNAIAGGVFFYSKIFDASVIWGITVGWYYLAANSLEAVSFLVLDYILRYNWKTDKYTMHTGNIELALDTLRGIDNHFTADELPEDVRTKIDAAIDIVGNLATDLRSTKQLYQMKDDLRIGGDNV